VSERPFVTDEALDLDGIRLVRGERVETRLRAIELADASWVELPLIVLRGARPGPVFYIGAAFHGDEVNGVEVATSFARGLDLAALSGTVLMVPAQNPLALQAQHRVFVGHYLKSPLDQSPNDPWISFPGDANGNMAAQLAHVLFDRLMRHADYFIDIHTPTTGGRYAPFAFLPPPGVGAAAVAAEEMAKASASTTSCRPSRASTFPSRARTSCWQGAASRRWASSSARAAASRRTSPRAASSA
jgi:predicted deacylase